MGLNLFGVFQFLFSFRPNALFTSFSCNQLFDSYFFARLVSLSLSLLIAERNNMGLFQCHVLDFVVFLAFIFVSCIRNVKWASGS